MKNPFQQRKYIIGSSFILIGLIFIIRLFFLQVVDSSYKLSASNNVLRYITQYPARGLIFDRHGKLLVYNDVAYDLMIIPRQVSAFDTTEFCSILQMTKNQLIEKIKKAKNYSYYKPSILISLITSAQSARLQEKLYKYSGFELQPRTIRKYPISMASHVFGYIGEVNQRITRQDGYYVSGDYIGISGIEKSYEKYLRGRKGVKIFLVDVHDRIKENFEQGHYDTAAIIGEDITLTLDADLQIYGEKLMQNKVGSIVAIEPSTGEILVLISSPGYDPNLLVGRVRSQNYKILESDTLKRLFNRALMAGYPPGSIFKIIQALIGLQERVIFENTHFACEKTIVNCHDHPPVTNLKKAIQYSCNPNFYTIYRRIIQQNISKDRFIDSRIGYEKWYRHVISFGFGERIPIDLPEVKSGLIPDVSFYDKWYGKQRWAFSTIYSNGIGQGEIEVIPLQMANLVAIIANRGYYYIPHIVQYIGKGKKILPKYNTLHNTSVDKKYFDLLIDAMQAVIEEEGGTARRAKIDSVIVCGKTGTAENPHGEDHSVFIAFAPRDNPRIAIAVYVENAGFGGTWAAPIASLMIEKYLTGKIKDTEKEKRIMEFKQYE